MNRRDRAAWRRRQGRRATRGHRAWRGGWPRGAGGAIELRTRVTQACHDNLGTFQSARLDTASCKNLRTGRARLVSPSGGSLEQPVDDETGVGVVRSARGVWTLWSGRGVRTLWSGRGGSRRIRHPLAALHFAGARG